MIGCRYLIWIDAPCISFIDWPAYSFVGPAKVLKFAALTFRCSLIAGLPELVTEVSDL
jgi:hypothetical protein